MKVKVQKYIPNFIDCDPPEPIILDIDTDTPHRPFWYQIMFNIDYLRDKVGKLKLQSTDLNRYMIMYNCPEMYNSPKKELWIPYAIVTVLEL